MLPSTRREFLSGSVAAAAAAGVAAVAVSGKTAYAEDAKASPAGANERFVVGIIGPGGQGTKVMKSMLGTKQASVAWVCDVDAKRAAACVDAVSEESGGPTPKTTNDMRKVLDDKSVDVVIIGTPDHWHAPATILACDAGKHVYVEKPASHNLREGRLMIDAARRNKRIVQVGTQSRSNEFLIEGIQKLKDGIIGDVLVSKAWNSQFRPDIGHKPQADVPKELDYENWLGPAPFTPYSPNKLHGIWRWWYDYGTGDIGNDGVHDIDIARWGLGVETHPNQVAYFGGQFVLKNSDQQWPDTYYIAFGYDVGDGKKKQLVYEQRTWCPYMQEGSDNGNAFYGTKGMMLMSKRWGWKVIGAGNIEKESKKAQGVGIDPHVRDFFAAIRDNKPPRGDIEIGHLSSSLSHLGNIAAKTGKGFMFDPKTEQVIGDEAANKLVRREYRDHWGTPKNV
jgi:predicted dehydrogenase